MVSAGVIGRASADFQTAAKWLQQSNGEDRYKNQCYWASFNLELGDYDEAETALAQAEIMLTVAHCRA